MDHDPRPVTGNTILNALPDEAFGRIGSLLERVDLGLGKVLHSPGEAISHVYFPEHAMVSIVAYTEQGQGTEVAVIGSEGAVGLAIVLGAESTPYENIVQLANGGLRIRSDDVKAEFERGGSLQKLLLQFTQKLIVQISQTAMCNRIHSVEQRLTRWLLMCRDRAESDTLHLTQEFLAIMLGSNRTSVTNTAIELQKHGFISYSRGKITIRDRSGLEEFTCSCYDVIRDAYSQK